MKNLKVLLAFFISAFMLPCTVLASDGGVAASIIKDPVVDTLFSIIIILSIVIEIKTAGFSGGSLIAILTGLILIGTNWYYEGGQSLEFALYFGGIALIILDILVMYTGIFIGAGFIAVMAGLFFSFGGNMTALFIFLFIFLCLQYWLPVSGLISFSNTFPTTTSGRRLHFMPDRRIKKVTYLPQRTSAHLKESPGSASQH